MSGLFKEKQREETPEAFDARAHLESVCAGGRIKIHQFIPIEYGRGWAELVEEMAGLIKRYPIKIDNIYIDNGQLDVEFAIYEKTQEVKVWRAIDNAKIKSRSRCMKCGEIGHRQILEERVIVICRQCIRAAEKKGVTGTWLDKY